MYMKFLLYVVVDRAALTLLKDIICVEKEGGSYVSVPLPKSFHLMVAMKNVTETQGDLPFEELIEEVIDWLIYHYEVRVNNTSYFY